jgi:hypothetical protein
LTAVKLVWDSNRVNTDFPTGYVSFMTFDNQVVWQGQDRTTTTDTRVAAIYPNADTGNGVTYISPASPFWVFPSLPDPAEPNRFEAWFENIGDLATVFPIGWEFGGTEFYFDDPNSSIDCALRLQVPPPPPTPTPSPVGFVPSPTFTPNCASSQMRVTFERFDPNGDVVLRVTNNRTVVAPFRGFELVWPAWRASGLKFESLIVSTNPNLNASAGGSGGATLWNSLAGGGYRPASVVVGNPTPPTRTLHNDTSAGTWNDNNDPYDVAYTFAAGPNSVTYIYLNFTGTGVQSLETRGVTRSDFNGTRFFIECGRGNRNPNGTCSVSPCNGGPWGGGGGGGSNGDIGLDNQPTPAPTSPPVPTNTPGPTPTPSRTPSPAPPTNTFTPRPPTQTFTPAPTQGPTNTPPPTATPTSGNLGGSDD